MDNDAKGADDEMQPPARLRRLTSWQVHKASTLGARITARHMPLPARAEFAVLAALDEYGPLSQADLGRRLGLDRNEVSGIVARLQRDHCIDRRADPDNRRRNVVTLTIPGKQRLEEIQTFADAAQDELLAGLAPAERQRLSALLAKLLDTHGPQSA